MGTDVGRKQVRESILLIFEEVTGIAAPRGLATTPDDVKDWSSLTQIRLLHAVEERFGCLLDERFLTDRASLAELADATCSAVGAADDGSAAGDVAVP